MDSQQVLAQLRAGNARYVAAHASHPHQTVAYRQGLVREQHPIAAVLGCADSRVPPEIIFDQGVGDLFVIRVAGNLVDDVILASVEYAVFALHVPLVVVLGHSGCGAVTAAVDPHPLPDHLPGLATCIQPAVDLAREEPGDLLENAIRINARLSAQQLVTESDSVATAVKNDQTAVVTGYYDLTTGKVEFETVAQPTTR